jgi:hypothetical protein
MSMIDSSPNGGSSGTASHAGNEQRQDSGIEAHYDDDDMDDWLRLMYSRMVKVVVAKVLELPTAIE